MNNQKIRLELLGKEIENDGILSKEDKECIIGAIKSRIKLLESPAEEITIYTDGACSGNPGPGGYGAILMQGPHKKEISCGYKNTTNNRMELMSVIVSLQMLRKASKVKIYTDSKYVVEAVSKGWLKNWLNNGWRTSEKKPVKNIDLWKQLLPLLSVHSVEFIWVKGHSENEFNARCDVLAVQARSETSLVEDTGYKGGE